jgi:hypothetical protein
LELNKKVISTPQNNNFGGLSSPRQTTPAVHVIHDANASVSNVDFVGKDLDLEAVQCAPQQQLLVVEVRWEVEFTTSDGTSKVGMAGTEEGSQ